MIKFDVTDGDRRLISQIADRAAPLFKRRLDRFSIVMDLTATSLAMENDIPVVVFALADPQNIVRAVMGEPVGTVVTK